MAHLIQFRARDLKLARPLILVLLIAAERRPKRTWCSRLRLLRQFVFASLSSYRLACNRTSTWWAASCSWRDAEWFLLSRLLPELREPGVELISLEEKNPVDLVVRHFHSSDAAVHGLSTPAEVLSDFGGTHPRTRPGAAGLTGETIENAGSTSQTIEDDVGHAICNRIDEFLRDRHPELWGGAIHDSMMPLRETPGNGHHPRSSNHCNASRGALTSSGRDGRLRGWED